MKTSPEQKIADALTDLVLDHTFFGTIALGVQTLLDKETETAGTDGSRILWGTDFLAKLRPSEVTGVTAHEVLHIALLHSFRKGARDHTLWNVACDYVINLILKDSGFTLPEGALIDEKFRDLTEEQVYEEIRKKARKVKGQGWGEVSDPKDGNGNSLSQAEKDALARQIQVKIANAQAVAKLAGTLPASLDRLLGSSREAQVEWRELTTQYLVESAKSDWSWRRPSRRSPRNIVLPSLNDDATGLVAVTIDLSGSISQDQGEQALAEALSVCQSLNLRLVVGSCDTQHYGFEEYQVGDPFPTLKGGGGTDFDHASEVLEDFISEGNDVRVHLFITDGETISWGREVVPTIWGIHSNFAIQPPFGHRVDIPQEVTA